MRSRGVRARRRDALARRPALARQRAGTRARPAPRARESAPDSARAAAPARLRGPPSSWSAKSNRIEPLESVASCMGGGASCHGARRPRPRRGLRVATRARRIAALRADAVDRSIRLAATPHRSRVRSALRRGRAGARTPGPSCASGRRCARGSSRRISLQEVWLRGKKALSALRRARRAASARGRSASARTC